LATALKRCGTCWFAAKRKPFVHFSTVHRLRRNT
jgi:hypothetical protein